MMSLQKKRNNSWLWVVLGCCLTLASCGEFLSSIVEGDMNYALNDPKQQISHPSQKAVDKESEQFRKKGICPSCRGMGKTPDGRYTCSTCNGTGKYTPTNNNE